MDNANADQKTFIIDLIHGYDENDFLDEKNRKNVRKCKSWKKKALIKANKFFSNSKTNLKEEINSVFPKKIHEK